MPGRQGDPTRRAGCPSVAAALVGLILAVGACSDDDAPEVDNNETVIETTTDINVEPTLAPEMNTSAETEFIDGVLADDVVSTEELEDAYERFIACLADGGAAGLYAYDIDLHVGLAADWSLASATAGANDAASLEASCSHDYLGDLIERYYEAHPAPPDLAEHQRESVVACVTAVNPAFADAFPDVMSLDTTGTGAFVGDLQLDPGSLGAEPGEIEPVRRCLGSLGAGYTAFG